MITCNARALQSFKSLLLDKLGPPALTQTGKTGKGREKAVVGSVFDCRVEKQKERFKIQAKSDLDCKIHLGKDMAHVVKLIEPLRGFDTGPSEVETADMLTFFLETSSATLLPRLVPLRSCLPPFLLPCPSSLAAPLVCL
jgi:hypothetical protein